MNASGLWVLVAGNVLLCAAFALVLWLPLGRWILKRLAGDALACSLSLSVALGMACWGMWILVLGLLGALHRSVILASAAITLVGLYFQLPAARREFPSSRATVPERVFIAVFTLLSLVYLGLVFSSALAPELSFDALNVHLPYARDAALAHKTGFAPNNWSSSMPALPLMSYILAFLFSGVTLAKLFNALCYLLCGGVIYFFTSRWWGRLPGSAAALLFWSCPVALYEGTTALIDLPVTLYSAVAILSLLEWAGGAQRNYLRVSACGLGLALGCKHHAVFWLVPIFLVLACTTFRLGHPRTKSLLTDLFGYFGIAALIDLPWLIRSWVYTGNPVFPLANAIFKSPYFTPAMERANWAMYANEGVGRSWYALLKLPLTVTFHPGPFRGTLGIIFLAGVLLAILRAARSSGEKEDFKKSGSAPEFLSFSSGEDCCAATQQGASKLAHSKVLRYGLICAGCYFCTWALTAQEIRYLLPLVPLLAVLTVSGILGTAPAKGIAFAGRCSKIAGVLILLAGAVLALPPLYPHWAKEWTYWHSYQSPFPYLLGRQSAEEYLRRDVPSIYAYEYINRNLGSRDRVLLLNDAFQFYSRVPTLYSFTVEGESILLQETEDGVLRKLKESRISHVLLNYNGIAPLPGVTPRLGVYFFLDKSFQERSLRPLYSNNNVVLYEVRS